MKVMKDLTKKIRSKKEWTLKADGGLLSCRRQTARNRGSIQDVCLKSGMSGWRKWKKRQVIQSAEGSAAWRGGAQILKKEDEDARLLDRCEAKRKEWANHWQRNESVGKASRLYKEKTGVGCDGFHQKIFWDLTQETRRDFVESLEMVDQSGKWPQQAYPLIFFLIPKNVTGGGPNALMPTLIRWWEAMRAPEVAKWPAEVPR